MRGQELLEALVERAFRLELFDDRFDHEIARRQLVEIVVGVADLDRRGASRSMNAAGFDFFARSTPPRAGAFRSAPVAGNVEQHDRDARRRSERGDPAAHRPRTHHSESLDSHRPLLARPYTRDSNTGNGAVRSGARDS